MKGRLAAFSSFCTMLFASLAHAEPLRGEGYYLPKDVSLEGWRIDQLIHVTGVFTFVLFVIMCIWMLIACVKHGKNHKAEYDHGDTKHHIVTAMVISSIIFLIVDGNLFYNSTVDLNSAFWNWDRIKTSDTVRIEINARQWAWEFRYAGPDDKFNTEDDIVTLNDMRVPKDAPISIQLGAIDVIHSFYLPNLRVKTDAVPGMINKLWFQATETGHFDIACAQHCGTHHYKMGGDLHVLSKEEFAAWSKEASINSARAYDPKDKESHWGWKWQDRS